QRGTANRELPRRVPEQPVEMALAGPLPRLGGTAPAADATLTFKRVLPPGVSGPADITIHRADPAWLQITPDAIPLAAPAASPNLERTIEDSSIIRVAL